MKFLCPNCKAKYQISDEKIAGRTLKMDCRRCSHPIVIRGDKVDVEASARASRQAPAQQPAARRRSGSYAGPAPTARSSARTPLGAEFRKAAASPVAPQKSSALDQWHVAINDVPVGPMKREEVARKIESGAVREDNLVWREGLDDWRPLRDVAELAALFKRHAPGARPPPPVPPPPSRALGARGSSPPVGARPRPAAPPRPSPEASRPAARGNVVPIGGRIGAAAAPIEDIEGDLDDNEPTRVGTAIDFEKLEAEQPHADYVPHEPQRTSSVPSEAASASAFGGSHAAFAPESEAFDPFASQRASNPIPSPAVISQPIAPMAPSSFAQPPMGLPPGPGSYAQFAPPEAAATDSRRRSLPVGAWIAIAGAMAFGVALAIMVAAQLFKDPAPPQVVINQPQPIVQAPNEARPDPDVAPQVAQPAPQQGEPSPAQPAQPQQQPRNNGAQLGGAQVAVQQPQAQQTGGERRQERQLSPEEAARLARFDDNGAGAAPINVPTGGNPLAEERPTGGEELSADQIRNVVNRERSGVQRCYETTARALGRADDIRVDVAVTVGGSGAVTSAVARGATFGDLTECIERTVRRWRFPATGGTTTVNIPFVFQGRE